MRGKPFSQALVLIVFTALPSSEAFQPAASSVARRASKKNPPQTSSLYSASSGSGSISQSSESSNSKDAQIEDIKRDIERLRLEALERMEHLNQEMHEAEAAWHEQHNLEEKLIVASSSSTASPTTVVKDTPEMKPQNVNNSSSSIENWKEAEESDDLYRARKHREDGLDFLEAMTADIETSATAPKKDKDQYQHSKSLKRLEDTRWRLMLNVGREPGTWMPKTWAASGERLRLHLEFEFTKDQLYEREDFLNGFSGAQVLKVANSEGDLAPCLQYGGRKIRIKEVGGWRVAPNEGPMGTSVLRFYFDLEEEAKHPGSDVSCPAGRIFCTCGYFDMEARHKKGYRSEKDLLKDEMRQIEAQYERLAAENEQDTDLVSWKKFQRTKKLMDLRSEATKLNQKIHQAHVREPDRSLLRLSQDQSIGLTREGGVCCKVHKGLAIEYHILGKFEIASMENREHSDYRELLP